MRKNVLVIDDDHSIAEVVGIFLEEEGFNVKVYHDGRGLDNKIKESNPDLMIIDYILPEINGLEVARLVRKKINQRFPIIMIAANQKIKEPALASGINVFINKPFDLGNLLELVNKYMN